MPRNKILYEMDGMSGDVHFWAKHFGISVVTLRTRLAKDIPLEKCFSSERLKQNRVSKRALCAIDGCKNLERVIDGGLCRGHEYRAQRYGSPTAKKRVITKERAYGVWQNMLASGIEVEWNSYEDFERDMGQPGRKNNCICRKDWSKGYSAENCFWGTKAQTRHIRMITIGGERKSITEWSKQTGISVETLGYRLGQKWPESKMLKGRKDLVDS